MNSVFTLASMVIHIKNMLIKSCQKGAERCFASISTWKMRGLIKLLSSQSWKSYRMCVKCDVPLDLLCQYFRANILFFCLNRNLGSSVSSL